MLPSSHVATAVTTEVLNIFEAENRSGLPVERSGLLDSVDGGEPQLTSSVALPAPPFCFRFLFLFFVWFWWLKLWIWMRQIPTLYTVYTVEKNNQRNFHT